VYPSSVTVTKLTGETVFRIRVMVWFRVKEVSYTKHVQALVITYDEIFQTLAVEGDVLLPKTFLDLRFDYVIRWKSPTSEIFFSLPITRKYEETCRI
jgi:hypothetical protein